jgi:hypothetical protein
MKGEAPPTKLLDKTIWNPRPVIGLVSRAVISYLGDPFFRQPKAKLLAPHPDPTSPGFRSEIRATDIGPYIYIRHGPQRPTAQYLRYTWAPLG